MGTQHVPEAMLGTEAQCRAMVPTLSEQMAQDHGCELMCAPSRITWCVTLGHTPQIGFFSFLKHLVPKSHFVKHWSGAMGEIYYQVPVTDEETEVQRG